MTTGRINQVAIFRYTSSIAATRSDSTSSVAVGHKGTTSSPRCVLMQRERGEEHGGSRTYREKKKTTSGDGMRQCFHFPPWTKPHTSTCIGHRHHHAQACSASSCLSHSELVPSRKTMKTLSRSTVSHPHEPVVRSTQPHREQAPPTKVHLDHIVPSVSVYPYRYKPHNIHDEVRRYH